MKLKLPIYFLLAVVITACHTLPKGPGYAEAPKPQVNKDKATIYILHFKIDSATSANSVKVNGKEVVALPQGYYSWFQASEGQYTISESTHWLHADITGANKNSSSYTLNVKNGKDYYIGFSQSLQSSNTEMGIMYTGGTPVVYPETNAKYKRYWVQGTEKEGKEALKYMTYVPAKYK